MASPKIPLFDLGNVIVHVDFEPFLQWVADKAGHGDSNRVRPFLSSSLLFDLEFGSISRDTFASRLGRLYGAEFPLAELEDRFCDIFPGIVAGMEGVLDELAEAGPVYGLSNTNEIHLNRLRERFPLMKRFTKVYASHEMARRKPYPGIYRDVVQELGVPAGEIVFFDDLHANVQGALRAGLDAHIFSGPEQVRERLKNSEGTDDKA